MAGKEQKGLTRAEFLEILLIQSKEKRRLEKKIRKAGKKLEDRRIVAAEPDSVAETALKLNGIFKAVQEAADQYLENAKQPQDKAEIKK